MLRWITGIIIAVVVALLLLYTPAWVAQGVVVCLAMVGFWEYLGLVNPTATALYRVLGILFTGVLASKLVFFIHTAEGVVLMVCGMLMGSFVLHLQGVQDWRQRLFNLSTFFMGLLYVGVLFSFWAWIRALPEGLFWVFILLACTFMSDTGAYLVGHFIGRHQLAPRLSPGKTVEGLLGGWIFSLLAAFIVRRLFLPSYPLTSLLFVSSLMAFWGPMGDLSESLIKRGTHAKDSSHLIPGHGGLLDRVDAAMFNGPLVYFFAKYWG